MIHFFKWDNDKPWAFDYDPQPTSQFGMLELGLAYGYSLVDVMCYAVVCLFLPKWFGGIYHVHVLANIMIYGLYTRWIRDQIWNQFKWQSITFCGHLCDWWLWGKTVLTTWEYTGLLCSVSEVEGILWEPKELQNATDTFQRLTYYTSGCTVSDFL